MCWKRFVVHVRGKAELLTALSQAQQLWILGRRRNTKKWACSNCVRMLPYKSQVRALCVCFLRRVFTINYINIVQTYCKQMFRHAFVASLGIGAREVSRSSAAKHALHTAVPPKLPDLRITVFAIVAANSIIRNGVGFWCRSSDSICDF
jgi:hypothetical protein